MDFQDHILLYMCVYQTTTIYSDGSGYLYSTRKKFLKNYYVIVGNLKFVCQNPKPLVSVMYLDPSLTPTRLAGLCSSKKCFPYKTYKLAGQVQQLDWSSSNTISKSHVDISSLRKDIRIIFYHLFIYFFKYNNSSSWVSTKNKSLFG